MKNLVVAIAVVFALMCSQACAQKKSESGSAGQASTSRQGAPVSTSRSTASKKTKESQEKTESSQAKPSSEKSAAKKTGTEKGPSAKSSSGKSTTAESSSGKSSDEKKAGKPDDQAALSDEQQKKIKSMLRQTLKPFTMAELTEEQRQKADEVFGKAVKDHVTKRSRALITDELQKKQTTAMKGAKAGSKSAREQAKEAFTTAGFSEEQVKVFKATQASMNKAKRDFGKTLSDEQIARLPEQLQALIKGEEK